AAPAEGGTEGARQGHAQHRRRRVRAVVDVLVEGGAGAADDADRIDIEQQSRRTALVRDLGEEHVRVTEGEAQRLHAIGVLVQQIPEIPGWGGRIGERQEHGGEETSMTTSSRSARVCPMRTSVNCWITSMLVMVWRVGARVRNVPPRAKAIGTRS